MIRGSALDFLYLLPDDDGIITANFGCPKQSVVERALVFVAVPVDRTI